MTFDASNCTSLRTIEEYAFYNDSELRLFKIGTILPPTCYVNAFYGISPYSVLKVPDESIGVYKTTPEWSRYSSITGLNE